MPRLHTRAADGTVLLDNRYAYDRSGNTIGCYGTQDQAEYRYDALDRLVEARYAGYGTEQLAYDAAGNRISRVWNGQQGQILNAYTYDAFGNMLSAREQRVNPFRYAGEIQDALTGHYYLRARFYNPIIARFTQEDTYRGDGLNLYAYVANNPIRYVDPSGYAKAGSGGTPASCVNKGDVHEQNVSSVNGISLYRKMSM